MRDNIMVLFCICELKFLIYDVNQFASYQCIHEKQCKVSCFEGLVQFYGIPKHHDYVSLKKKKRLFLFYFIFIYLFIYQVRIEQLTSFKFQILKFLLPK